MVVIKTALKEAPCNCYNCEYPKDTLNLCGKRKHVCMLTGEKLYNMDFKPDTCPLLEIDTGWINVDERLPEPMKKSISGRTKRQLDVSTRYNPCCLLHRL